MSESCDLQKGFLQTLANWCISTDLIFTAAPLKRIQTTPVKRDFDFPLSFHYQQILNWWFVLVVWIPKGSLMKGIVT